MDKTSVRFPWENDGDVIAFDTPEQTRVEYLVAPIGTRILAAIMDYIIITLGSLFLLFLVFVGSLILGSSNMAQHLFYLVALVVVLEFLFTLFYYVWFEIRKEGHTWGKRRMNIRTVMMTGHGITLGASIIRNLARVVDNFPVFWVVPVVTRGKRRLGDLLAGTIVVVDQFSEKREGQKLGAWLPARSYKELEDRRFYFSDNVSGRLFREDLNLLEYLEERLLSVHPHQRPRFLQDIARRYVDRLELQEQEDRVLEDPAGFLQELTLFLRDRFEGEAY